MLNTTPNILSPRLQRLQTDLQALGSEALPQFWTEIQQIGTPLIEPGADGYSLVTFLWRADESTRSIAVIQDWGTDGIREHHLTLLPTSDVWYLTRVLRSDTRTTYQLSPSPSTDPRDRAPYQTDPLNPKTFAVSLSEFGSDILFSLLELPEAPALPWHLPHTLTPGTVRPHTPFADGRRLWVYLPPITACPTPRAYRV